MGRIYTQTSDIASFTEGDIIELNAPSDAVVILHSIHVGLQVETDDSSALLLQRATTAGAGGNTTGITPAPMQVGDAAFGGTYREAATTDAAGTLTVLQRWNFSALMGLDVIWTPETRPVISPSGRIVLNIEDTLTAATLEWNMVFEEIGG